MKKKDKDKRYCRGDLVWVDLGHHFEKHVQAGRRLCLIVSTDKGNNTVFTVMPGTSKLEKAILAMAVKEGESIDKLARLREAICIFTDLTKKEASNGEQRSKLLFDAINQVKQELNATSKNVQDKLHAMGNTPLKKVVTHRFEPTSKYLSAASISNSRRVIPS